MGKDAGKLIKKGEMIKMIISNNIPVQGQVGTSVTTEQGAKKKSAIDSLAADRAADLAISQDMQTARKQIAEENSKAAQSTIRDFSEAAEVLGGLGKTVNDAPAESLMAQNNLTPDRVAQLLR